MPSSLRWVGPFLSIFYCGEPHFFPVTLQTFPSSIPFWLSFLLFVSASNGLPSSKVCWILSSLITINKPMSPQFGGKWKGLAFCSQLNIFWIYNTKASNLLNMSNRSFSFFLECVPGKFMHCWDLSLSDEHWVSSLVFCPLGSVSRCGSMSSEKCSGAVAYSDGLKNKCLGLKWPGSHAAKRTPLQIPACILSTSWLKLWPAQMLWWLQTEPSWWLEASCLQVKAAFLLRMNVISFENFLFMNPF